MQKNQVRGIEVQQCGGCLHKKFQGHQLGQLEYQDGRHEVAVQGALYGVAECPVSFLVQVQWRKTCHQSLKCLVSAVNASS